MRGRLWVVLLAFEWFIAWVGLSVERGVGGDGVRTCEREGY